MKKPLKNIVSLNSGINCQTYSSGEVAYIKGMHIKDNLIQDSITPEVLWDQKTERHFLQENDILIMAKGDSHKAVVFHKMKSPAVASSSFIILRNVDQNTISSDYLAWFINHPETQKMISTFSKGTALSSININSIENLPISIPSLEKQQLICKIHQLELRRIEILKELLKLTHYKTDQQLLNNI